MNKKVKNSTKVALCLYGLVGGKVGKDGKGGNVDYMIAYEHYKKHIFDKNNVDVFIHSWSIDLEQELKEIYKFKKSIFQKQKRFAWLDRRNNDQKHRAYSRWYSSKKTIELKREYEIEKGFVYDWVMVSRLDLAFFTDVIFDTYDPDYFYASHWNDAVNPKVGRLQANRENHYKGTGFLDLWFFSNSKIMDKFSTLYDNRKKYKVSAHVASREHVDTFTDKIKYVFYRWDDHELVRRKFLSKVDSQSPQHIGMRLLTGIYRLRERLSSLISTFLRWSR